MKVKVEIPDKYVDFLKTIANLHKKDPEQFLQEIISKLVQQEIEIDLECMEKSTIFDWDEIAKAYNIERRTLKERIEPKK